VKSMRFDEGGGARTWHAHMNSDLSGYVRFVHRDQEFEVPAEFLQRIVADWVRRVRVARIEQETDWVTLLGGKQ